MLPAVLVFQAFVQDSMCNRSGNGFRRHPDWRVVCATPAEDKDDQSCNSNSLDQDKTVNLHGNHQRFAYSYHCSF